MLPPKSKLQGWKAQKKQNKTFHQLTQGSTETPRRNDPNVTSEQHFSAQASALLWAQYCLKRQPVLIKNKTGQTLNPRFLQAIPFYTQSPIFHVNGQLLEFYGSCCALLAWSLIPHSDLLKRELEWRVSNYAHGELHTHHTERNSSTGWCTAVTASVIPPSPPASTWIPAFQLIP